MRIAVYREGQKDTTMNYARYLVCLKEKRILDRNEDVHHRDENKLNDSLNNLEIKDHSKHVTDHQFTGTVETKCSFCQKIFQSKRGVHNMRIKFNFDSFCSASCKTRMLNAQKITKIKSGIKLKGKIVPIKP